MALQKRCGSRYATATVPVTQWFLRSYVPARTMWDRGLTEGVLVQKPNDYLRFATVCIFCYDMELPLR